MILAVEFWIEVMQNAMATDPAPGAPKGPIPPSNTSNTPAPQADTQAPQANTQPPQAKSPSEQPKKFMRIEKNISLGAIQIMTGLVHIGLGALSVDVILPNTSVPLVTIGGYPFWGGVIFIVSGSLTVAAANYSWNSNLMGMSFGFNLASAMVAIIGIILYVFQLVLESGHKYEYDAHKHMAKILSIMLCSILICFSLLELCLAFWAALIEDFHHMPAPVAAPYTYGVAIVPSEGNSAPPNP